MKMRLQRALARAGVASRRASEDLIREGRVRVNGAVAELGQVVDPEADQITIGRRPLPRVQDAWILLHKPVGYVTSRRDSRGRPTVFELVPEIPGLTYVGRLDFMTEGLLLLTTDGAAINALTHPRFQVEREYVLNARGRSVAAVRSALERSVMVDGRRVDVVRFRTRKTDDGVELRLTLREGRNRIVRRLAKQLGLQVDRLRRVAHGPVRLGALPSGKWRYLNQNEIRALEGLTRSSRRDADR